MTAVEAWLAEREPPPPAALAARLRHTLSARVDDAAARSGGAPDVATTDVVAPNIGDAFLMAGEALAAALLRSGCTSREAALDLLTADALVTYAFEAVTESPDELEERAQRAMARISALAAG